VPSMDGLVLALRGTRFRLAASLVTLLMGVVAVASATLGPMYSATAQDSLVRFRLTQAPVFQTGLVADAELNARSSSPPAVISGASELIGDPAYGGLWGPESLLVGAGRETVGVPGGGSSTYSAAVSWRQGMCTSVRMVRGKCPDGSSGDGRAEAMVSARTAARLGIGVGSRLSVTLTSSIPGGNQPVVVGIYDVGSARAPGWVWDTPAKAMPPQQPGDPETIDEVLVDRATIMAAGAGVRVTAFRPLRTGAVHARDLPALARLGSPRTVGPATVASSASTLAGAIDSGRAQVRSAATAVTVQLGLLALFVLYLVVAATAEERGPEVALAKLRGMRPGATAAFTLTEPVLLLVLSVPIGIVAAFVADLALARGLTAGSEVRVTAGAAVAAAAGLVGGVGAAALAVRQLLATPVIGQLRRTGRRRSALATAVVDTAAVAVAGAGVYELVTGSSDLVGLAAPGLLALAAGLLVVRLVAPAARIAVARTRRSPRLTGFLAARNTARRPAGTRLVVLLAVAVALAVFGVDGQLVARTVTDQTARAQVGAARVVHVDAPSPGVLLAAVRAADPTGRAAMAAVSTTGSQSTPLLAVDISRLAAVSAWDPAWGGTNAATLATQLAPRAPPVMVTGALTGQWANTGQGAAGELRVSVDLLTFDGRRVSTQAFRLGSGGRGRLRLELPPDCQARGCRLIGWDFTRTIATGSDADTGRPGTVRLASLADPRGPLQVTAAASDGSRWRYARQELDVLDPTRPPDADVANEGNIGFTATLHPGPAFGFTVVPATAPLVVPALLGSAAAVTPFSGLSGTVTVPDLAGAPALFTPISGSGVLPRVGRTAAMVDLATTTLSQPRADSTADDQVWFTSDADAGAVLRRLAAAGVRPVVDTGTSSSPTVETVRQREQELGAGGPAVGLRLYVVAAVAAVLLALGALLTTALVAARRRSYEVAAVLALGGRRSALTRAGAAEQLVLVAVGIAVGAISGVVTSLLALPVLTAITAGGPAAPALVLWRPVVVIVAAVFAVATVVALVSSHRVVRLGVPERLREVQG